MSAWNEIRNVRWRRIGYVALRLALLMLLLGSTGVSSTAAQTHVEEPLVFGVYPWGRPSLVGTVFNPIVDVIVRELGRPVRVQVAETYEGFLAQSAAGTFDIVHSPVSFMEILLEDYGFSRLVAFDPPPRPILYARKSQPLKGFNALRGRRLAMPPRLSVVSLILEESLREAGIDPEHDLSLLWSSTTDSALIRLLIREADAALTTPAMIRLLAPGLTEDLMVVHEFPAFASTEILMSPVFSKEDRQRLRRALFAYSGKMGLATEAGVRSGFRFIAPPSSSGADIARFGQQVRKRIQKSGIVLPPPNTRAR